MDGNALPARDEPDDRIARHRRAAAGEFDEAVVHALNENALHRLGLLRAVALDGFVDPFKLAFLALRLRAGGAGDLVLEAVDRACAGDAAVADGGVHIVETRDGELFDACLQKIVVLEIRRRKSRAAQLAFKHLFAADDVLLAALLFEPLADLGAGGVGLAERHPVAARPRRGFGRDDINDIAVLQRIVKRHDAPVDLCADHPVADGGMDTVGKVDRACAGGEVHHVALRREYEHLVVEHVHFEIVNEVLRVGVLLRFEQAADPGELLLISGADACAAGFVLPVCGDAVFADAVHLPGADLHLEHDALLAEDGRMHALVAVGLGRGNVVLEAARHGAEHVMDVAENIVAVGNIVHDDAERAEIEDLVQTALLRIHLAVNAVGMLDAALHRCVDAVLREPVGDLLFDIGHELVEHVRLAVEVGDDLTVAVRVEIFEREVLELPLHLLQAEPVGDGRIDLHRFERLFELLLRDHVFHRAHIV